MFPESDPLAPLSSRFPLSPTNRLVPLNDSVPSPARPFGLRFATGAPIRRMGEHEKRERHARQRHGRRGSLETEKKRAAMTSTSHSCQCEPMSATLSATGPQHPL